MALRTFFAFDNDSLLIDASSPFGTAGDPVINNSSTPDGTIFEFGSGYSAQEITLDDTLQRNRFNDDEENDHIITDGSGIVANGTPVEAESLIELRALDSFGNPTGPVITLTVMSQNGVTGDVWGFGTDQFLVPGVKYVKVGGSNDGTTRYNDFATCFAEGASLRTASGDIAVEDIVAGTTVWTTDGLADVSFVARSPGDGTGSSAPIKIQAGALGNQTAVRVSPQHRILVESPEVELLFDLPHCLVPAIHLVGIPGVRQVPCDQITYIHLVFDRHRIVDSAGLLSESFFPGAMAMGALDAMTRLEVQVFFPDLAKGDLRPAAPQLKAYEGRLLAEALARSARAA